MKIYHGNTGGQDPTCWIDCECGEKHLFVSDGIKKCPKCSRGYITDFQVQQFEPDEEMPEAL